MEDLAIKNGVLVTPQGRIRGGLTVSGGKITEVGSDGSLPKARQELDAQGFMVLPGLTDPHVHLGQDKEEKFRGQCRSESISAALGGITTMITTARFGNALAQDGRAFCAVDDIPEESPAFVHVPALGGSRRCRASSGSAVRRS